MHSQQATGTAEQIRAVESGLGPSLEIAGVPSAHHSLEEEMSHYRVPGVSVAFVHNGKVEWAKGYGVTGPGATPVNQHTLFQAASISKSLTAMGALRLVEQGKLSLDAPINSELKTWQLPGNAMTTQRTVTLRELVSHHAGINVHGFSGYITSAQIPTLIEVLDGIAPAKSQPIRVETLPGASYSYAGGGYVIAQQAMMDVTGESFASLMEELVLRPEGMLESSFQQPLKNSDSRLVALPVDGNGSPITGGPLVYPELAAAGLWTTPSDLAKFVVDIQETLQGHGRVLQPQTMQIMLTEVSNQYGLGIGVRSTEGKRSFLHTGGNEGYRAVYFGYDVGDGVVIMTSGNAGDAVIRELLRSMAVVYDWPDYRPLRVVSRPFTEVDLTAYAGTFRAHDLGTFVIRRSRTALEFNLGGEWMPLSAGSGTAFFATNTSSAEELEFFSPDNGRLLIDGSPFEFTRLSSLAH